MKSEKTSPMKLLAPAGMLVALVLAAYSCSSGDEGGETPEPTPPVSSTPPAMPPPSTPPPSTPPSTPPAPTTPPATPPVVTPPTPGMPPVMPPVMPPPSTEPPTNPPPVVPPAPGPSALNCEPSGPVPELKKTMVAQGLNNPTEIVGDPEDPEALWVLEHEVGDVRVVKGGTKLPGPALAHVSTMSRGNDEEGMQSIAIHPDYATNKLFYIFYSAAGNSATTVDEFKRTGPNTSEKVRNIYTSPSGAMYHNGGQLDFWKGELYISVGENQNPAASQAANGQLGRVLKLNIMTPSNTGETIVRGLRNPYRMSFDAQTGDMYIADVGDSGGGAERLFFVKSGTTGTNFGWGGGNRPAGIGTPNLAAGTPIIGGFVYRGKKMPGFCGRYIWGSYRGGGNFRSIKVGENGQATENRAHPALTVNALTGFGRDSAGELYFSNYGANGTIYRIDPM
jgi:glucose/arabinose dehydrogenase